jgi:hypothetical protein
MALFMYRRQYCLLPSPEDAVRFNIIDEDDAELPPGRQGGIAHFIPELLPTNDQFTGANGMRVVREPTRRRAADSASVIVTLMDCDWKALAEGEACRSASLDTTNPKSFTDLGMMGVTDFPHYHFDPEADERSAYRRTCQVIFLRHSTLGCESPCLMDVSLPRLP